MKNYDEKERKRLYLLGAVFAIVGFFLCEFLFMIPGIILSIISLILCIRKRKEYKVFIPSILACITIIKSIIFLYVVQGTV